MSRVFINNRLFNLSSLFRNNQYPTVFIFLSRKNNTCQYSIVKSDLLFVCHYKSVIKRFISVVLSEDVPTKRKNILYGFDLYKGLVFDRKYQ